MEQVRRIRAVLEKHMKQVGGIRVVHCFSQAAFLSMSWWFGMFCDFVCFGICFVTGYVLWYALWYVLWYIL